MKATFQFLGTGASAGVPLIGCKCPVCSSSSPKDKRLRPSGFFRIGEKVFLVDTTPDLRAQALLYGIERVDGLLLTHTHFDHIAGIDDLRIFNVWQNGPIPCLLSKESFEELKVRYAYLFDEKKATAKFNFLPLEEQGGYKEFLGVEVGFFHYRQSEMKVTGFRIGDFAYMTDVKKFDDSIFSFLRGIKTLVISSLKPETSLFHLSFEEAVSFAKNSGAEMSWITHLGHFYTHDEYNSFLPKQVQAAYDGLELEFTCTK
jgi:phosphoribosyl 1,2-cyclic phosphate phosphodiesterase